MRLELPEPEVGHNRIRAVVLAVDRFGNVALNLRREHLEHVGARRRHAGRARPAAASGSTPSPRGRSPTRRAGRLILYEDSYGNLALAVSRGSAA